MSFGSNCEHKHPKYFHADFFSFAKLDCSTWVVHKRIFAIICFFANMGSSKLGNNFPTQEINCLHMHLCTSIVLVALHDNTVCGHIHKYYVHIQTNYTGLRSAFASKSANMPNYEREHTSIVTCYPLFERCT